MREGKRKERKEGGKGGRKGGKRVVAKRQRKN
jgi:hypothetical protein